MSDKPTPDPRSPKDRPRQPSSQVFLPEGLEPGERRPIWMLPPGATMSMKTEEKTTSIYLPLWKAWLQVAESQAAAAEAAREPEEVLDHISAAIAQLTDERLPPRETPNPSELQASMTALVAAAAAVDGFYGAVKPLVNPPSSKAKRSRQVVEALKLGFKIGPRASHWTDKLDWLFECRDFAVHHGPEFGGLYAARVTDQTIVIGPPEVYFLSAPVARRAVESAQGVISDCLENPKAPTREWVEALKSDVPHDPTFTSHVPTKSG